ncbi:MAG TPA: hypothetical protein VK623_09995 [Flavobacterium sp.]|nr:hypothetical protein [Flavobacterium sp.]
MSQLQFIGSKITFQSIRDYIFEHKVNRGDSIVLNPQNYEHIVEEIKNSPEGIDIPVNVFGVLLIKDTTDTVETGKIQIVKNEIDQ